MGGRGASSGIRRGKASNAKYNGFSITDEKGNTNHYIVIGGHTLARLLDVRSR